MIAERLVQAVQARMTSTTAAMIETAVSRLEARLLDVEAASERQQAAVRLEAEDHLAQAVEGLRTEIRALGDRIVPIDDEAIARTMIDRIQKVRPWSKNLFIPRTGPNSGLGAATPSPFMIYSTCSAADFLSDRFAAICAELAREPIYHRKLWEWVFIAHHLRERDVVGPGKKGLVFGVGTEPLPSLFAKQGTQIVATDAPGDIGIAAGWGDTQEYAAALDDIRTPEIIGREAFARFVTYAQCDMNNIGAEFTDFDFCWSSCCLEHLGSLEAGMDFIVNSVEKTLKIGGVACHTTEFNLSSDDATVRSGPTVIYRKRDIISLIARLRDRGHSVADLVVAPHHHPLDFFVDVPPYAQNPHLKLDLMGYTATSVGIIVRRGR